MSKESHEVIVIITYAVSSYAPGPPGGLQAPCAADPETDWDPGWADPAGLMDPAGLVHSAGLVEPAGPLHPAGLVYPGLGVGCPAGGHLGLVSSVGQHRRLWRTDPRD